MTTELCGICKRPLDVEGDPMSADTGGDCWGCIGFAEFEMEKRHDPREHFTTPMIESEIRAGFREADGQAKRPAPKSA